jgi:hypothetical protein
MSIWERVGFDFLEAQLQAAKQLPSKVLTVGPRVIAIPIPPPTKRVNYLNQ